MNGLMMDYPLTITSIMHFAERCFPNTEIVSVTHDNPDHRYTYKEAFKRVRKLANGLKKLGMQPGENIATLAWNDYRHLELYYAVSCSGSVCHTINPRLFPEQLEYIINNAENRWIFIDPLFIPLLESLQDKLTHLKGFVVLTNEENLPASNLKNAISYEALIASEPDTFDWPQLDEKAASALCYTSGTTGNPKGVLYSHRSTFLHAYAAALPDVFNLSIRDTLMPVVPMFHINGWGMVYSGPMIGCKLVLPGPKMGDGAALCELIKREKVTSSAGVPTVWLALLQHLETTGQTLETLNRITVGGAACPRSIMEEMDKKHNVYVHHAWGMTEMSPLGVFNSPARDFHNLDEETQWQYRLKQGRPIFGVDIKIVDDNNQELPWDGKSPGSVKVRGPWITCGYYKAEQSNLDDDGWFETGDVATMDEQGFMQITDRTKDLIKSGGEWISSIELENCAVDHPKVTEAAVIGIAHEKWTERPLLLVVKQDDSLQKKDILDWFDDKVASWWIPSDCVFVSELPHTATGKLDKKKLRLEYANHIWSED